jgi:hypothetical protein
MNLDLPSELTWSKRIKGWIHQRVSSVKMRRFQIQGNPLELLVLSCIRKDGSGFWENQKVKV